MTSLPVLPGFEPGPKEGAHLVRTPPLSINMRRFPENRNGHLGDRAAYDSEVVHQLWERNFGRFFYRDHSFAGGSRSAGDGMRGHWVMCPDISSRAPMRMPARGNRDGSPGPLRFRESFE
jgi:hypothetical protein